MNNKSNPFALEKASEITDQMINDLWVELGPVAIQSIIEPSSTRSKFILGGKGTGKTHILRYYSYSAVKLRNKGETGLNAVSSTKFLAVFVRATGLDAARFEIPGIDTFKWQQLFGVYFELRLAESVLDALLDIVATSPIEEFDEAAFVRTIHAQIVGADLSDFNKISDIAKWVLDQKRLIDDAINNAAFSGILEVRVPFSIGKFAIPIARAMEKLTPKLGEIPLIYLIDEIENFSESQQQVINTLIRYGEGLATFRVTGRLYARKTLATLADGEENRERSEFKTSNLDDILRSYSKYPDFCARFVVKRLALAGISTAVTDKKFSPSARFEELSPANFYTDSITSLGVIDGLSLSSRDFSSSLISLLKAAKSDASAEEILDLLTDALPPLIQKLNMLMFSKKLNKRSNFLKLANDIRNLSTQFVEKLGRMTGPYSTAYGHYSADLFAQICRGSRRALGVPYAGFDTFVRMSWGNPRNLLIILGHAYEIAQFREIDFISGAPLSVIYQTQAASDAARFTYENDTNYGRLSDVARDAVRRLAEYLRAARFSLRIPEVSPLTISFSPDDLSVQAQEILNAALKYSLVYEVYDGRTDRNKKTTNRKIQINPMLSPRWGLPVVRRGDISLNRELLDAIFVDGKGSSFDNLLKIATVRWNSLLRSPQSEVTQPALF
jgi:hypothetical protein